MILSVGFCEFCCWCPFLWSCIPSFFSPSNATSPFLLHENSSSLHCLPHAFTSRATTCVVSLVVYVVLSWKLYFVWHPVSYSEPFVSLAINAINRFSFMFIPDKKKASSFSCFQLREDFFLRDFVLLFLSWKWATTGQAWNKHSKHTPRLFHSIP